LFGLKTGGTIFSGLTSKPVARVFQFGPQNRQHQFGDLCIKITATVSWFEPQNQADFGLSVAPQNRWREYSVGYTSRSGGLLCLKASRVRVFQSDFKTGRAVVMGGARDTITEVASRSS
jgi:hypothetical protein